MNKSKQLVKKVINILDTNKKLFISHAIIFCFIIIPGIALAQGGVGIKNPIQADSIGDLVTTIVRLIRFVALPFIVLAIMYAGFKYVLAQGKPEKIKEANNIFLYTLIGALIVLSAELMSALLNNSLK